MSTSDGNSTTRPLRRRQSKRFDRSGGSSIVTGSTIVDTTHGDIETKHDSDIDDGGNTNDAIDAENGNDLAVDIPEPATELSDPETGTDRDRTPYEESDTTQIPADTPEPAEPTTPPASPSPTDPADEVQGRLADPSGRHRTLDQMAPCGRCGHDVSIVHIEVDGNILMMESCDNCDTRRWQLAGEPIELQQALDHVGEHTGRRR